MDDLLPSLNNQASAPNFFFQGPIADKETSNEMLDIKMFNTIDNFKGNKQ